MSKDDAAIYVTVSASGQTVFIGLEVMPEPPTKKPRRRRRKKEREPCHALMSG